MPVPKYVMVPIPERYVGEVMGHLMIMGVQEQTDPWESTEVHEFFDRCGDLEKALLAYVARRVLAGQEVEATQVTDFLRLTEDQLEATVGELNQLAMARRRPVVVFLVDGPKDSEGAVSGPRTLRMSETVAGDIDAADAMDRESGT